MKQNTITLKKLKEKTKPINISVEKGKQHLVHIKDLNYHEIEYGVIELYDDYFKENMDLYGYAFLHMLERLYCFKMYNYIDKHHFINLNKPYSYDKDTEFIDMLRHQVEMTDQEVKNHTNFKKKMNMNDISIYEYIKEKSPLRFLLYEKRG